MAERPPGLLRASENPDVVMMICTAGHVDHGKTRLVKMLTGCNTDRLTAEQERGLTIELGFAPCTLGGDLCVGIVDVPGHEKFVKNMVAGVSGIGLTVLVIAADDGIMPQTAEHLQIMELLGVRNGLVALTKTDLVQPERVPALVQDIGAFLEGTFLEGAPICPVSSETGEGYFDFYDLLVSTIKGLVRAPKRGVFRMPVERVFVKKGFGTVVTGIPVDGAIEMGARVEAVPGGQTGKVRNIQRFLRDASEGGYGQCLAINVPDFTKKPPERGDVLCEPGYLKQASCFHVRLRSVPGLEHPVRHGEQVKLHAGTSEQPGKVYLLDERTLTDGGEGLATIVTAHPVAAVAHDRFIIRRSSPAATVAGGEILAVTHGARPRSKPLQEQLQRYTEHLGGLDPMSPEGIAKRAEWVLLTDQRLGASSADLSRATMTKAAILAEALETLVKAGTVTPLQADYFIHGQAYAACVAEVEQRIAALSEERKALNLSLGELRKGLKWPGPIWMRVLDDLQKACKITVRGDTVVVRASVDKMSDADRALVEKLLDVYDRKGFTSPRPEELPEMVGAKPADVERLMKYLCNEGQLVRLAKNVVLGYNTFATAQEMVVKIVQEKGALDSADFKQVIGSTRKYAIAILDFLDTRRVTVRTGNLRRLAANYEKNLL
jgi:selenocysteine-specific elongation factor